MFNRSNKANLIIMTRWPAVGRCKRRLAKDIGASKASSIQKILIEHTLSVARELEKEEFLDFRIAITGIPSTIARKSNIFKGVKAIENQGKGCLGLRLRRMIIRAQIAKDVKWDNQRPTIVIGSDLPTLCKTDLISAIEALKNHEMVIGPAIDGGYWLIGLSGGLLKPVISWPFCGIPWGSNQVLNRTTEKADLAGINYGLLNTKNDLDQLSDLLPWQG